MALETRVVDEEQQLLRVHGAVYTPDAQQHIQSAKALELDLSLQALSAQVVPQRQRA